LLFTLKIQLNIEDGEIIAESLSPDDVDWAKSYFKDGELVVEITTSKIGALINAVDDFFMNIKSAVSCLTSLKQD